MHPCEEKKGGCKEFLTLPRKKAHLFGANLQSGPKAVGLPLSLFSFIHPLKALTLTFCQFTDGIVTPNSCIQIQFPLNTPCFKFALNSGVRASTMWINIVNGERRQSLVITPERSNTFGPDCSSSKGSFYKQHSCKMSILSKMGHESFHHYYKDTISENIPHRVRGIGQV